MKVYVVVKWEWTPEFTRKDEEWANSDQTGPVPAPEWDKIDIFRTFSKEEANHLCNECNDRGYDYFIHFEVRDEEI